MANLIFTLATSGGYSTGDFTDGDGYSVTSVVANGADWDITMSGPSGTATKTFTDAQLSQPVVHNVVPPAITENPAGTFTATDGGGWFYDDTLLSAEEVEYTLQWVVGSNADGTGLTFTKTHEAQDYQDIDFVVTPSYGEAVTVRAQEVADYIPSAVEPGNTSSEALYSGAGTLADVVVLAGSWTCDAVVDTFSFPIRFENNAVQNILMRLASNGEVSVDVYDEAGVSPGNVARSNADSSGETFCYVIMHQKNGSFTFTFKDTAGNTMTNTATLPADKRLLVAGDIQIGGGAYQLAQHRVALWSRSTLPDRTPSELLTDLFGDDCKPRAPEIGNAYLGTPRWGVSGDAESINNQEHEGTWSGTVTVTGSFVNV